LGNLIIKKSQKEGSSMIPIAHPLIGTEEQTVVFRVLTTGQLAQGEQVAAFERHFAELCQVQEAVAVSSGTAALHLALLAHGIGLGDEVITTAFSFVATANAILLAGATPVFVDIEPDTYNIDPALIEAALTPLTRAILPVHLYGNPCDMKIDDWMVRLRGQGIDTSVHYPIPIYRQPFYRDSASRFQISCPSRTPNTKYETTGSHLPVAEITARQTLSLPVHPALSEEALSVITRKDVHGRETISSTYQCDYPGT